MITGLENVNIHVTTQEGISFTTTFRPVVKNFGRSWRDAFSSVRWYDAIAWTFPLRDNGPGWNFLQEEIINSTLCRISYRRNRLVNPVSTIRPSWWRSRWTFKSHVVGVRTPIIDQKLLRLASARKQGWKLQVLGAT